MPLPAGKQRTLPPCSATTVLVGKNIRTQTVSVSFFDFIIIISFLFRHESLRLIAVVVGWSQSSPTSSVSAWTTWFASALIRPNCALVARFRRSRTKVNLNVNVNCNHRSHRQRSTSSYSTRRAAGSGKGQFSRLKSTRRPFLRTSRFRRLCSTRSVTHCDQSFWCFFFSLHDHNFPFFLACK